MMESSEVLQKKLYFLVEQLQNMARELPPLVYPLINLMFLTVCLFFNTSDKSLFLGLLIY